MHVPREQTQIPADELVSYDDFVERLQALKASSRIQVQLLERSREGRGIYAIVVSDENVVDDLAHYKSVVGQLQRPSVRHTTLDNWQLSERPAVPDDIRYPVMIIGQSFGHEASHVEALIELAEHLAWSQDAEVTSILAKLVVLIVPMMNPDGREMAIDLWQQYPLAEDSSVAGNRYGFYINRDFLHLTQPEGKAILKLFKEWHSIALYDTHEDAFLLGVLTPEVCWFPEDGVTTATQARRNIQEVVNGFGAAIKVAWEERGYNYYPQDMFAFPMIGQSPDQPKRFSMGNITGSMSLHGVPSLITESARTPGSQVWRDRVDQKVTAGLAVLKQAANNPAAIADAIYHNAREFIDDAKGDAFIVARNQTGAGAVAFLVDRLLRHEVCVYETNAPEPAFVIPLAQPRAPLIRQLLSSAESKLIAMPPALGITVLRLSALSDANRVVWRDTILKPVLEAPVPSFQIRGEAPEVGHLGIPNTWDGVQLVNRLWQLGAPVYWLTQPLSVGDRSLATGCFVVADVPVHALKMFAKGLHLDITAVPSDTLIEAQLLKKPSIALYAGQGVDRPHSSPGGELWWGLENLEFDFVRFEAHQMHHDWLSRHDILLIPEGNARDIVDGWHTGSRRNSEAWDLPGQPAGIGAKGLEAITSFVKSGGAYVGLSSGGGLLATEEYAGLIELTVSHHSLGSGRVVLQIEDHNNPLVYGLNGYTSEDGNWHHGRFLAMYETESFSSVTGGPIFKAGAGVEVVASYHSADHDPDDYFIIQPQLFAREEQGVAVAFRPLEKGSVSIIGVRPGFRAIWTHSFKLISNAIFAAVSGDSQKITLP